MPDPLPVLLLETGTRTNTPSIDYALEFLSIATNLVDGLLWDPGNSVFAGFLSRPVEDEWAEGKDLIKHVHVKDPGSSGGYVRLGNGTLPWPALLQRMSDDGYRGWLSLETHWRHEYQLDATLRDQPHGYAFSSGGLGSSVECMQILRHWVANL
jgi:sugar phosphate isomerase/epimerase